MAKLLNWLNVAKKLKEKEITIFSPREIAVIFGATGTAVNFFVYRNAKRGLIVRLKKSKKGSLYALADNMPDEYVIANRLYEPSYVSLDTALSYHKIIPETIYAITSVTTKATRTFEVSNICYQYFRIKKSIFTGYKPLKHKNRTILMAEPEKALADYLYFIDLKKRTLQLERLELKLINRKKLMQYIKFYSRPYMFKIADKIYADRTKHKRIY